MLSLSITLTILSAGVVVLLMRGPLSRTNIDAFHAAMHAAVRNHRPHRVQLDFSGVIDIDAEAAAAVIVAARVAARDGTVVTVTRASASAQRQFMLTGGHDLLA